MKRYWLPFFFFTLFTFALDTMPLKAQSTVSPSSQPTFSTFPAGVNSNPPKSFNDIFVSNAAGIVALIAAFGNYLQSLKKVERGKDLETGITDAIKTESKLRSQLITALVNDPQSICTLKIKS